MGAKRDFLVDLRTPLGPILWGAVFVAELRSRIIQVGAEEVLEECETNGSYCSLANDLGKEDDR